MTEKSNRNGSLQATGVRGCAAPGETHGSFRSRAAAAEPTCVGAFAPALADGDGADRVLHLAAWQEYGREFSDAAAAQLACRTVFNDATL